MSSRVDLDRKDPFVAVQKALAGHSEMAVMQALLRSLLAVIGIAAPDIQRALAMIDSLPAELKPLLEERWPSYRLHRAKSEAKRGQTESDLPPSH